MDDQPDLYALPLEEFVAARDTLAKSLRRGGEREEAERVRALRRPSPAAWAINQLAGDEGDAMQKLLAAGERLREAQDAAIAGRADARGELRAAMGDQRAAIEALLGSARELTPAGRPLSAAMVERIRETLMALATHPELADAVAAGRLTAEVEPGGGWPEAADGGEAPAAAPKPVKREKPAKRRREKSGDEPDAEKDDEARRRAEEAEQRQAEAAEREHEQAVTRARKQLGARAKDLERAERALATATDRREDAERVLERAVEREREGAARVGETRRAAEEAEAELERLQA